MEKVLSKLISYYLYNILDAELSFTSFDIKLNVRTEKRWSIRQVFAETTFHPMVLGYFCSGLPRR